MKLILTLALAAALAACASRSHDGWSKSMSVGISSHIRAVNTVGSK